LNRFLLRILLPALALLAAALFLVNTSLLARAPSGSPSLIAHRGTGQTFSREGLTGETCTAAQMLPPGHEFLENTIAGFDAAFAAGADIVEFDVQPTTDGSFVVFHDWTLDCRTNGSGETRNRSLAELKTLDIGYGYTADGGRTFPFRGKGVGLMPTLDEVLDAFPGRRFMINIKSRDPAEGEALAAALVDRDPAALANLIVYGAREPLDAFAARLAGPKLLSTDNVKRCLLRYFALGWSGYVPAVCRQTLFMLPLNVAPWTWGYPHRLAARMAANGTDVVLLGAYDGSGFSSGVDSREEFAEVPERFDGAVWTNRIDLIGPASR
jgi:glycerophosphoryl diester phosphodiesterase